MKNRLLLLPVLALALNLAHAAEVVIKPASEEHQFKYFDSSESNASFAMLMKDGRAQGTVYVSRYDIPAPSGSARTATLCNMPFVVDRVEKGLLSSKKTVYYRRTPMNASKIAAVRNLKPEELAKLGLSTDDNVVIRRIDLVGGDAVYAVGPNDSHYAVCGKDEAGTPYLAEHFTKTSEYYRGSEKDGQLKSCSPQAKQVYQTLPEAGVDYLFQSGSAAEPVLAQCREMKAAQEQDARDQEAREARNKYENEERFEREKKAHKMKAGVDLLGSMGAVRAHDLVHTCLKYNFMVDKDLSSEERKGMRCQGYYTEEVEALQRELRLRGLD